jgi:hypothetical protein
LIEVQALAPTENTIEFGKTSMEDSSKNKKNKLFMIIPSQAGIPLLTPAAPFN